MKLASGLLTMAIVLSTSSDSLAQATTATQTFEELGKRLEDVQRQLNPPLTATDRPQPRRPPPPPPTIEKAIKLMEPIIAGFSDNPWVRVKGFKVGIGFPPSIDIDFEVPQSASGAMTPAPPATGGK
jgi:hypothetical protein